MQYSMSFNEEQYEGRFDTLEEAVAEAANRCHECDTLRFWVGEIVPPRQPEEMFDATDFLWSVSDDDTYTGDWAADWDLSTREQKAELEASVKASIAAWLDKHCLRPKFWNIDGARRYDIVDGQPVLFTSKKASPLTADELIAQAGVMQ